MDFQQLANQRYSVRKYASKPVSPEHIEHILETARKAPSAVNFQPYKIYVVTSDEKLNAVKACYHRAWIQQAPVIMVLVGLHAMAWKRGGDLKDHTDIDVAILSDHLMLQAAELGLGTCWVGNFDVEKLTETLQLKPNEEPIAMIPLGFPESDDVPVKKRKGLDDIVVRL
jgi:nitroreductase